MLSKLWIALTAVAATVGVVFATFSTGDFVQHLDRGVHGLHCSFVPGLADADVSGESGCHVTLMSPYSSVFREAVWGGIPISLPAMAVFGFLLAFAVFLLLTTRENDKRATGFLLAAWGVPLVTSLVMAYISLSTLDAACKVCIGIYAASFLGTLFAAISLFTARPAVVAVTRPVRRGPDVLPDETLPDDRPLNERTGRQPDGDDAPTTSLGLLGGAFAVGVLFVVIPVAAYAAAAPDFDHYTGTCGALPAPSDPNDVLVPVGAQTRSVPVIEILDPLCPSCRGFEQRFDASSIAENTSRKILLFPLDSTCNWMVSDSIHPGACAVSEAILCAEDSTDAGAEVVIDWAFEHQEQILEASARDPEAAARMAKERFPAIASCIGQPAVQARLNRALRWAVDNQLPILTPQVYVGHHRLCDADTDLGMDYALTRLVAHYRANPQPATPDEPASVPLPRRPSAPSAAGEPPAPPPAANPPPTPTPNEAPPAAPPSDPAPVDPAPADPPAVQPQADPAPTEADPAPVGADPAPAPAPSAPPPTDPAPPPAPAPSEVSP